MDAKKITKTETVSASKKLGRSDALRLLKGAETVYVSKGKNLKRFDTQKTPKGEIADAMLGPTGNLRAPCAVMGKVITVGFSEETFEELFG